ncbi:MAG: hypothetical protein GU362_05185 [Thaumarchaeota archaeon]|jgi:5,10-methylenetetrahydrofolate reductase|nr:hypothetical protein [Nitrososphaerota archaeon]
MKIYFELPEIYLSNFERIINYTAELRNLIDGIFVPDLPLKKPTIDACALIGVLKDKMSEKEIIITQSVGHRSLAANKSRLQCIKKMGINSVLLVQGPYTFTKVNDVLDYAFSKFRIGAVFNEKTLESRIKGGVKFFVTQVFPEVNDLKGVKKISDLDLFLTIGISNKKENYLKLKEKGFNVPEELLKSDEPLKSVINYYATIADYIGKNPDIYLIALTKELDYLYMYDFVKRIKNRL